MTSGLLAKFTLSHDILGELEINEPDGWKECRLHLERHKDFHSLVEHFEGEFIFYGVAATGENGGIDFIREVETTYGFDADLRITIELSYDGGGSFRTLFTGLLDLANLEEMVDNKMKVPIIPDNIWARFINRLDTPVDLSSTTTLDGDACDPVMPVTINLTNQKVRQNFEGYYGEIVDFIQYNLNTNKYGQVDFGRIVLNEIDEKFTLPRIDNPVTPSELFAVEYAGNYTIDIDINTSTSFILGSSIDGEVDLFIQINDDAAIQATRTEEGSPGVDGNTRFTYTDTHALEVGDTIRVYFFKDGSTVATQWGVYGGSSMTIQADTVYPDTTAEGYLLHDAFYGVIKRITGQDCFYSEFIGSTLTNERQYSYNGCGWMYVLLKGLQIRQYTLSDKPFFTSFKQLWEGANPILNLGVGFETLDDSPDIDAIRLEEKAHFYQEETSIEIDNVRQITRSYDEENIFKTVKVGYKKWQSEDISGIDDPQTKKTYALPFKKTGRELVLESDFIAASLAIEVTRRRTIEKSKDYKFDNDTFIIALNPEVQDLSPETYNPELDENFQSVTNLLNSETRYNLLLTPMRSFFRWANVVGGCMERFYSDESYKFVSGEGNYDMVSDFLCGDNQCRGIICDNMAENQDIPLGSPSFFRIPFGYIHLPDMFDKEIPLELEEYESIRSMPKNAIGFSQTETGHVAFFIKDLSFSPVRGTATVKDWARDAFSLSVISTSPYDKPCT